MIQEQVIKGHTVVTTQGKLVMKNEFSLQYSNETEFDCFLLIKVPLQPTCQTGR